LTNRGLWPVRLAAWGLTICAPGGTAVVPQPPLTPAGDPYLLPNRSVVLWPYTPANDPRILWGEQYLCLRPDPGMAAPIKLGTQASEGWCGYVNGGHLFLKRVARQAPGATHPDGNCGVESYTAGDFIELETLGALVCLEPGESTCHSEHWFLFEGADASDEDALDRTIRHPVLETEPASTTSV
ncbi:MAG TPA: hypothetical protein VFU47_06180, partial [Armatimonadota bacterium]|nr:hypothetical protein [Armatimonadota bacterium]